MCVRVSESSSDDIWFVCVTTRVCIIVAENACSVKMCVFVTNKVCECVTSKVCVYVSPIRCVCHREGVFVSFHRVTEIAKLICAEIGLRLAAAEDNIVG